MESDDALALVAALRLTPGREHPEDAAGLLHCCIHAAVALHMLQVLDEGSCWTLPNDPGSLQLQQQPLQQLQLGDRGSFKLQQVHCLHSCCCGIEALSSKHV
jgi:hypothetical protein